MKAVSNESSAADERAAPRGRSATAGDVVPERWSRPREPRALPRKPAFRGTPRAGRATAEDSKPEPGTGSAEFTEGAERRSSERGRTIDGIPSSEARLRVATSEDRPAGAFATGLHRRSREPTRGTERATASRDHLRAPRPAAGRGRDVPYRAPLPMARGTLSSAGHDLRGRVRHRAPARPPRG
jgi:hypothetical protein